MGQYNQCEWVVVGRAERCERQCVNALCGIHRAQLRRKPDSEPHPCRRCGKGTKSEIWLCSKACGADRAQKALRWAEAKARRLHRALMLELLLVAQRQRVCPFIGLR